MVTEEAASRPSRTVWTKRASGNSRRRVCASLTLCELISTRPGLPCSSASGHSRSTNSCRQAATGSEWVGALEALHRGVELPAGQQVVEAARLAVDAHAVPPEVAQLLEEAAQRHPAPEQVRHAPLVAVEAGLDRDVGKARMPAQEPASTCVPLRPVPPIEDQVAGAAQRQALGCARSVRS